MADTIDIYGDAAVFADIVERDITEYEDSVIETIGDYAFYSCYSLASVNLPAATGIGDSAFYSCSKLTSVNLPAATRIGNEAFAYCSSLTSINIPAATRIANNAFYSCSNLTSVNLPAATYIGINTFSGCYSLTSVYILASSVCTLYGSTAFWNTPMESSSYLGHFGSIYVPSSLVSAYKSATNWTYYADRITAYTGE